MVKFLKYVKALTAVLIAMVLSLGTVVAIDNTDAKGKNSETEIVNPEPGVELKKTDKEKVLNADSLKSAKKIGANTTKSADGQSKVKKSDNTAPSIFSYNFVFYLMYKFKIADIFNISKEKNQAIKLPDESSIIVNGKKLINTFLHRIRY